MTAEYYDSGIKWQFRETDGTLPVYRINKTSDLVSAGTFPKDKIFRVYEGKVIDPWSTSWAETPQSGYYAVELAPYIKGQHWAAYNVPKGLTPPSPDAQVADKSSTGRRVWAKTADIEKLSLIIDPSDNAKAEAMGAIPSNGGNGAGDGTGGNGAGDGTGGNGKGGTGGNGKGGTGGNGGNGKPKGTGEGSNWLWWVLAAGSAVAGAPIAVPLGLAAIGIASTKKENV